jgi:ubiquinone/menaquinone biosynthesis C-methylase UbiE
VTYTHGHHESVLRSHLWRTVENSAAYLMHEFTPGRDVLDVGCGPGTITTDIAGRVEPGHVIGIDPSAQVIEQAQGEGKGVANVEFKTGDVYALGFDDATFDIVHAHQVMHHLPDPVAALREMRRVCKPDGIVGARESDYGGFTWYPADPQLDAWRALFDTVARKNQGEPNAGRHLYAWARAAGFSDVQPSASVWCFATPDDRAWWGGSWADRMTASQIGQQAVEQGFASQQEVDAIADAWRAWAAHPDGWFVALHGEVRCRP